MNRILTYVIVTTIVAFAAVAHAGHNDKHSGNRSQQNGNRRQNGNRQDTVRQHTNRQHNGQHQQNDRHQHNGQHQHNDQQHGSQNNGTAIPLDPPGVPVTANNPPTAGRVVRDHRGNGTTTSPPGGTTVTATVVTDSKGKTSTVVVGKPARVPQTVPTFPDRQPNGDVIGVGEDVIGVDGTGIGGPIQTFIDLLPGGGMPFEGQPHNPPPPPSGPTIRDHR